MRVLLALAAVLMAAPAAGAQELDVQIRGSLEAPAPVSAYADVAAWSERDAAGAYRLMVLRGTQYVAVAVDPRPVPFDVDVGPDRWGRPLVAYSRCRVEPIPDGTVPDYTTGSGCDLYAYDVTTGREHRLGASTPGNDVLPSIWGRRVTYVHRTGSGARSVRVAGVNGGSVSRRVGRPRGGVPRWLDVRAGRAAILWRTPRGAELRIGTRTVARSRRADGLLGLGFDRGVLFFRTTCAGTVTGCEEAYWAYRPRSRSLFVAVDSADLVAGAHGGGNTYALLGTDSHGTIGCPCRLVLEDRLEFGAVG